MTHGKRWGIATRYAETIFRSRLEARWAAFFDLLEWKWTYEPFDGSGYIPDFLIKGGRPFVVETRPAVTCGEYEGAGKSISIPWELFPRERVVLGVDPLPDFSQDTFEGRYEHAGGLMQSDWNRPLWLPVIWFWCAMCDGIRLHDPDGDFRFMPCGHGDGDHHLHGEHRNLSGAVEEGWRIAGNKVRWNPA